MDCRKNLCTTKCEDKEAGYLKTFPQKMDVLLNSVRHAGTQLLLVIFTVTLWKQRSNETVNSGSMVF